MHVHEKWKDSYAIQYTSSNTTNSFFVAQFCLYISNPCTIACFHTIFLFQLFDMPKYLAVQDDQKYENHQIVDANDTAISNKQLVNAVHVDSSMLNKNKQTNNEIDICFRGRYIFDRDRQTDK